MPTTFCRPPPALGTTGAEASEGMRGRGRVGEAERRSREIDEGRLSDEVGNLNAVVVAGDADESVVSESWPET